MAGIGNAAATTGGFLTKFVAGAKGFMSGLLQPMQTWKGAVGGFQGGGGIGGALKGAAEGSGALQAVQAGNVGQMVETGAAGQTPGLQAPDASTAGLEAGAMGPPAPAPAQLPPAPPGSQVVGGATQVPAAAPAVQPQGMLGKAAGAVGDFAKSTGGGLILTSAIQGLAQGKMQEDMLKHGDYYDRKWADPRQLMILDEASREAAGGFLDRARRYESTRVGAVTPARPRVGYQRGPRGYAGAGG